MKICLICTTVYTLPPPGYSGLEMLVYNWAVEFARMGHKVSVVAPEGSQFPPGLDIELVPIPLRVGEDAAFEKYKDRLGEFDAVLDNSWGWYSVMAQMEAAHQLPVIHCYHSDPHNLNTPPPIEKPCICAFSEAQADIMRQRWNVACQVVHHGVDLSFYKPDPSVERGSRYLFLARYTPEKGFLEIAHLARKCRVGLDAFGDTEIIASQEYAVKCFEEADSPQIRVNPGIPREETVRQYRSHKALITWPNYVEIFGLTTVEAMACGTPVLSKDSGAARELIKQGVTGYIVSTLEQAEELIKKDAFSEIKPEDCVRQARKFSIEKNARGLLKLCEDVKNGFYW